jgi:hypothetical protein
MEQQNSASGPDGRLLRDIPPNMLVEIEADALVT